MTDLGQTFLLVVSFRYVEGPVHFIINLLPNDKFLD